MKNTIAKYLIEFIVIITGISLSFYVEKLNETNYKENLKNQSLGRILKNIEVDTKDFKFNLDANKKSIYSTEWLAERNDKLQLYSRDSVGYHLNRAIFLNTILVDNQEEYRGLQNSGLIELIDNENLVTNLQEKYVTHEFFKKIEDFILKKMSFLEDFSSKNLRYNSYRTDEIGMSNDRIFIGRKNIPYNIIESLKDKRAYHNFYTIRIKERLEADKILVNQIKKEINRK